MPVLQGLVGGHGQECRPPSNDAAMVVGVSMRVFRWRVMRLVGIVLIPTLTACRKIAMCLSCGGKKGIDHGKIDMVWGCLFCLFANCSSVNE
jgi:hypothetical protein